MTVAIFAVLEMNRPPDVALKHWRAALKSAFYRLATIWHRRYLPRHFAPEAFRRYGYASRSTSYNRRKLRLYGHTKALVLTGRMQRELMGLRQISSTAKGSRIRMRGRALNFSGKTIHSVTDNRGRTLRQYVYPDMKREVTATHPHEERQFADIMRRLVTRELNRPTGARRRYQ